MGAAVRPLSFHAGFGTVNIPTETIFLSPARAIMECESGGQRERHSPQRQIPYEWSMGLAILLAHPSPIGLNFALLIPVLSLVGALLAGALVIAWIRRWQKSDRPLGPNASDQLAEFRSLYEQGAISEEEFKRLRAILGEELRRWTDDSPSKSPASPSRDVSAAKAESSRKDQEASPPPPAT
ncbi:MAG: SHOCT domain-containing protein [Gemmataceae bacterium]